MGDVGTIYAWAGPGAPPSGWLLCNGQAVSRATYADLFAAIGTGYGVGDGSTTFNLPDQRGRFAIGRNSGVLAIDTLGKVGGALDHTHTGPSHTHPVTQPATHAAHVVTQPSSHTGTTHTGADLADHAAASHSGSTVAGHSVSESSGHGTHATSGDHNHDDHIFEGLAPSAGVSKLSGPTAHSTTGAHTHNSHSAHTETVSAHSISSQGANHAVLAHTVTQPSAHTASHSGAAVGAHGAHTGFATQAASVSTGAANPPFLALPAIIGTGATPAPAGTVVPGAGSATPAGHVACDGASYTTAAQPDLFAAIGYTFGGSGANFNVPDLRGRHVLGLAAAGTGSTHGGTGGAAAHTHAGGSHSHGVTQGASHADHTITQPATHTLAHAGGDAADHASQAHSGFAVANHTVTQSSGHGTHSSAGGHTHSSHTYSGTAGGALGATLGGPTTHTSEGSHTHDAHSSHTGAALSAHAETQPASHAAAAHTITQPSDHSAAHTGAALSAHSAHSGAATSADGTAASGTGEAPYLGLPYLIKTTVGTKPIGTVFGIGRTAAPTGSLLADGAAVSRTTYASLFAAIGTTFGAGDGSTTFNVPDLRGRIPRGSGGTGPARGATGGALGHTHTGPSHTHPVTQPATHSAHSATQPAAHASLAHAGFAAATHTLTHTGQAIAAHTATQASGHGTHSTGMAHDHDTHDIIGASDIPGGTTHLSGPVQHADYLGHTHGAHSSHSGFGVDAHVVGQPSSHSLGHTATQPSAHSLSAHAGFAVDAHGAHSGFATSADGTAATGASDPAFLVIGYAIQWDTDVETHFGAFVGSGDGGFTVTLAQVVATPAPTTPPSSPTVYVLDPDSLAVLGILERAAGLKVTRRYWGADTIELRIDERQAWASQVQIGRLLYLPLLDFDAPLAFLVEQREFEQDETRRLIVATGRTLDGLAAADRICYPPGGQAYDTQSAVPAETAMKHYVTQNAGSGAAANRQVPHLTVATDGAGGGTVSSAARYQRVMDVLLELGYLSGVGWKVTFEAGTNSHVFEVVEGVDRSASVFFDFDFDSLEAWQETASILDAKTLAVVAGQGEGVDRDIVVRPSVQPSGRDRREAFVDARDVEKGDTTLLNARGDAILAAIAPITAVQVTPRSFGPFQYTQDWHLGDVVLLRNAERGVERDARVVEVTLDVGESAAVPTITATLDRPDPTLRDRVEGSFAGAAQDTAGPSLALDEILLDETNRDVRLYRSAAKTLTIDDGAAGGLTKVALVGAARLELGADVGLYRSAAKTLTLDDGAAGALTKVALVGAARLELGADVGLRRSAAKTLALDDGAGGALTKVALVGAATLELGADVGLRRSASKTLSLDDNAGAPLTLIAIDAARLNISRSDGAAATTDIYLTSPTSSNSANIYVERGGDTTPRAAFRSEGIEFGPGSAARDLRLRRSAASALTVDDGAGGAASIELKGKVITNGLIVSTLNADANDYNPTGWHDAVILYFNAFTANRTVTGFDAGVSGEWHILMNDTGSSLLLPHQSASSAAGNRMNTPGAATMTVRARGSVLMVYAGSKWWPIGI